MVVPPNVLSVQLLDVVAETAACEDALYHADRVLENGTVQLEDFLKEMRKLARKQFLAKALARRICMSLQRASGK
jgi:ESCRT-I complex subunit TSG101